jgi:FKBP-type peptidyl-prolyl cis-trans isomerase 2
MKRLLVLASAALVSLALIGCAAKVADKKVVQVSYKGTLDDGAVFASTVGQAPMEVMIGGGFWIPALEEALIGLKVGDKKQIKIKAADAFGEHDPNLTMEVSKQDFPDYVQFRVGLTVQAATLDGPTLATIAEVKPETVIVDYNHPLAGKDLTFDVEILKIRKATDQDLAKYETPAQ